MFQAIITLFYCIFLMHCKDNVISITSISSLLTAGWTPFLMDRNPHFLTGTGDDIWLNVVLNFTNESLLENSIVTISCKTCEWHNPLLNEEISVTNNGLIMNLQSNVIKLFLAWKQLNSQEISCVFVKLTNQHGVTSFNGTIVCLNASLSCSNTTLTTSFVSNTRNYNHIARFKFTWFAPDNDLHAVKVVCMISEKAIVFSDILCENVTKFENESSRNIVSFRFKALTSVVCELSFKLAFAGVYNVMSMVSIQKVSGTICYISQPQCNEVKIPLSNLLITSSNTSNLMAGDRVNFMVICDVQPQLFSLIINITVIKTSKSSSCQYPELVFTQNKVVLNVGGTNVTYDARIMRTTNDTFAITFEEMSFVSPKTLLFNFSIDILNNLLCMPNQRFDLIFKSDHSEDVFHLNVAGPLLKPYINAHNKLQLLSKELQLTVTICHSNSSRFNAYSIHLYHTCPGLQTSKLISSESFLKGFSRRNTIDGLAFIGEVVLLKVGENVSVRFSLDSDHGVSLHFKNRNKKQSSNVNDRRYDMFNRLPLIKKDSCSFGTVLYWRSKQLNSPQFGPYETNHTSIRTETIYKTFVHHNYGFVVLGIFIGMACGAVTTFLVLYCLRRNRVTRKYILHSNEVCHSDAAESAVKFSPHNAYTVFTKDKNTVNLAFNRNNNNNGNNNGDGELFPAFIWRSHFMQKDDEYKSEELFVDLIQSINAEHQSHVDFVVEMFYTFWFCTLKYRVHLIPDLTTEQKRKAYDAVDKFAESLRSYHKKICVKEMPAYQSVSMIVRQAHQQGMKTYSKIVDMSSSATGKKRPLALKRSIHDKKVQQEKQTHIDSSMNELHSVFKLLFKDVLVGNLKELKDIKKMQFMMSTIQATLIAAFEEQFNFILPWLKALFSKKLEMYLRKRCLKKEHADKFKEVFADELSFVGIHFCNERFKYIQRGEMDAENIINQRKNELNMERKNCFEQLLLQWDNFTEKGFEEQLGDVLVNKLCVKGDVKKLVTNSHQDMCKTIGGLTTIIDESLQIFLTRLRSHASSLYLNLSAATTMHGCVSDNEEDCFRGNDEKQTNYMECICHEMEIEIAKLSDRFTSLIDDFREHSLKMESQDRELEDPISPLILLKSVVYCMNPIPWTACEKLMERATLVCVEHNIQWFVDFDLSELPDFHFVWGKMSTKEEVITPSFDSKLETLQTTMSDVTAVIYENLNSQPDLSGCNEEFLKSFVADTCDYVTEINKELLTREQLLKMVTKFLVERLSEMNSSNNEELKSDIALYKKSLLKIMQSYSPHEEEKVFQDIKDQISAFVETYISTSAIFLPPRSLAQKVAFDGDEITCQLYYLGLYYQQKEDCLILYNKLLAEHKRFLKVLNNLNAVEEDDMLMLIKDLSSIMSHDHLTLFNENIFGASATVNWRKIHSMFTRETHGPKAEVPRKRNVMRRKKSKQKVQQEA